MRFRTVPARRTLVRALRHLSRAALGGALCIASGVSACGTNGDTPKCTTFPDLYDIRDPAQVAAQQENMRRAAAEGCLTLPAGFDGTGGQSGSAGAAGRAGAAGSAGAATAGAAGAGGGAGNAGTGGGAGAGGS